MATTEPVSEFELHAYVDDQLDLAHRIDLESYLAEHPLLAARVMADLRARDALRLVRDDLLPSPPARTLEAARRVARGLARARSRARHAQWLGRTAVATALVAAGWLVHAHVSPLGIAESEASPPPPAFAQDAVRSHQTALIRAGMRSQPEASHYDPDEIRAATQIVMPTLPRHWQVLDVQVFPSRGGPSVEMALDAKDLGTLSLFAMRTDRIGAARPAIAQFGAEYVAYWSAGHLAYALTGTTSARGIERAARALADRLEGGHPED